MQVHAICKRKDILGHADLKTTERYLHAQRASVLADAATRAFATPRPVASSTTPDVRRELAELLEQLADDELGALLASRAA